MLFNSLKYCLFLPIVYLAFYFSGDRARWFVLLGASLLFYAALNVPYLLIVLVLVAFITYLFGGWIDKAHTPDTKRALLWCGIASNVLILVLMKYLSFLSANLNWLATLLSLDIKIHITKALVAVGVSYYVFQALSYLFDVYLEIEKPERHFGYFFLYLAFFPKLLQGPIERASDLIPQLRAKYEFVYHNVRFGMLLFTWGLLKKVVIADRIGLSVDRVFNDVHTFKGLPLLLATYAYAVQIYMDFSGYTDMALGSALLFNINLTQNFNSPYLATSVADFWRRWHISFSRWVLEYLFKPLQMQWRNWKNWGSAAALIIAFFVSGIWHGASWGFVVWGLLHGLYMACSVFYKPYQKKMHKALHLDKTRVLHAWQIFVTFNLVSFAWIFFRANSLSDALYVCKNMINVNQNFGAISEFGLTSFVQDYIFMGQGLKNFLVVLIMLFLVLLLNKKLPALLNKTTALRVFAYNLLLASIILLYSSSGNFIYFKF